MSLKTRVVEMLQLFNCPGAAKALLESKSTDADLAQISADDWKGLLDTHNPFDALTLVREIKAKPAEHKAAPAVHRVAGATPKQMDMFGKILMECLEEFMKPNAAKPEESKH